MSTTTAGVIFIAVAGRGAGRGLQAVRRLHVPGGLRHRGTPGSSGVIYRLVGVNPAAEQTWGVYARSVLAFSAVSILFLYAFQRLQDHLWLSLGFDPVMTARRLEHRRLVRDQHELAVRTRVSRPWATWCRWPAWRCRTSSPPRSASRSRSRWSAGFARSRTDELGNFWVDLTRITLRILLPIAVLGAIVLIVGGAVQNLSGGTDVTTLTGGTQTITGGPVASQEVDQGARHQRRRLLQRQQRPPVREPDDLDELARDLPDPADPVQPAPGLRPDGRAEPAGLRDRRGDGDPRARQHRPDQRLRAGRPRHGAAGGRRGDGGQGGPVRRVELGHLRRRDHADLDRCGELVPRLVHGARRR